MMVCGVLMDVFRALYGFIRFFFLLTGFMVFFVFLFPNSLFGGVLRFLIVLLGFKSFDFADFG